MTELQTGRLQLRLFRPDDFEAHAEICADPEVMRYIRAGAISRLDAWWQLARYMGHWQLRGFGLWAVVEKSTDRLIGHLGFLDPEGGEGFELGWALARHAWGKGYALEGTRAAVQYAFTTLKRDHIACVIRPENASSIRLAGRLGGRLEKEIVEAGARLLVFGIKRPDAGRFREVYARVEKEIEERYRITVNILDVVDPNTGDFNGERIDVDHALDPEIALFVLLHLFGHTVQWNVSAGDRELGRDTSVGKTPEQLAKILVYERDATRYAVTLLNEIGVADLDAWLSDLWLADWKYLEHYYTTGEKLDFRSLVQPGAAERLTPLDIPRFTPQRWVSRWSF